MAKNTFNIFKFLSGIYDQEILQFLITIQDKSRTNLSEKNIKYVKIYIKAKEVQTDQQSFRKTF